MSTKELIKNYFEAIHQGGWESYIADDFTFTNLNLDRVAHGKNFYLEGAGKFFRSTTAVDVRRLVIEDNKVALIARYSIRSPEGSTGVCDVAEFLTVKGGKLTSSAIFFDSKALFEFMARG